MRVGLSNAFCINISVGGLHITEVAFLLLTQPPRGFLVFPKIYFNVAEIYRRHWIEESGKRLDDANQTHLVPAS